jgi:tRNA pseudouridine38-40 synthase
MVADPNVTGIVLVIEYDGRNYHGSQYQANARTIQGELEKALRSLTGKSIRIKAGGRTDAGVHARGQVISFGTDAPLPLDAYVNGLNHYLPDDIAVKAAYRTARPYDVRRRAVSRVYRYRLYTGATPSPLRRGFAWRVDGKLDVAAMQQACRTLVGRHDFASFVASAADARRRNTVRDMMKAEITQDGDTIVLELVAGSFLPHQVRTTIGALVKVGQGKMTAAEFGAMVAAAAPGLAGPMAPADGLYLVKVNYPGPFEGEQQ